MRSKRVRLTVIASNEPSWMPRTDVPATRAECPTERPCRHVYCRHHLWMIIGGADGVRAGRPGLSRVARDESTGLTLSVAGDAGDERPGSTLEARWIGETMPPSCSLDVADRGAHGNQEVGACVNRHRTLAAREIKRAATRARQEAIKMGVDERDFVRALLAGGD